MKHLIRLAKTNHLDSIRHKYNVQINAALTNKWLDDETIKEYMHEQNMLQRYPFLLQNLFNKIRKEISSRVRYYGT